MSPLRLCLSLPNGGLIDWLASPSDGATRLSLTDDQFFFFPLHYYYPVGMFGAAQLLLLAVLISLEAGDAFYNRFTSFSCKSQGSPALSRAVRVCVSGPAIVSVEEDAAEVIKRGL